MKPREVGFAITSSAIFDDSRCIRAEATEPGRMRTGAPGRRSAIYHGDAEAQGRRKLDHALETVRRVVLGIVRVERNHQILPGPWPHRHAVGDRVAD